MSNRISQKFKEYVLAKNFVDKSVDQMIKMILTYTNLLCYVKII